MRSWPVVCGFPIPRPEVPRVFYMKIDKYSGNFLFNSSDSRTEMSWKPFGMPQFLSLFFYIFFKEKILTVSRLSKVTK